MDLMFSKYKDTFVAAINHTLDMLYNSRDISELKKQQGVTINEDELKEFNDSIATLERIRSTYQSSGEISTEDEKYVIAALGVTIVNLEYLADSYKEAAKQAKIIIANIINSSH